MSGLVLSPAYETSDERTSSYRLSAFIACRKLGWTHPPPPTPSFVLLSEAKDEIDGDVMRGEVKDAAEEEADVLRARVGAWDRYDCDGECVRDCQSEGLDFLGGAMNDELAGTGREGRMGLARPLGTQEGA